MLQWMCVYSHLRNPYHKKNGSPETFHSIWVFHWTVAAHALQAVIGLSFVPRETCILVGGSSTPVTLSVSVASYPNKKCVVDTWFVHIWGFKSDKNPSTSCLALTLLEIILKSWTWYFCILKRSSITNLVWSYIQHSFSPCTFSLHLWSLHMNYKERVEGSPVSTARYIGELNPLALSQAILQDVNFPSTDNIRH